jgi:hypothetical protein
MLSAAQVPMSSFLDLAHKIFELKPPQESLSERVDSIPFFDDLKVSKTISLSSCLMMPVF